jgi:Na+/melibiose symporter-like transporter
MFLLCALATFVGALYCFAGVTMSAGFSRARTDQFTIATVVWSILGLVLAAVSVALLREAVRRK